tara:strand:- start:160 stop:1050 length:891 start_codon:yes stop_codon:yes gene_type:complete
MKSFFIKGGIYFNNSNISGIIKTDFMKINSENLKLATEHNAPNLIFNKLYKSDNTIITSDAQNQGVIPPTTSDNYYSLLKAKKGNYENDGGISPSKCPTLRNNFSWMDSSQNLYKHNFISSLSRNQTPCGSCYAFVTIQLIQFRVSMWHFNTYGSTKNIYLSVQNMLERHVKYYQVASLYDLNGVCSGAKSQELIKSFNEKSYDIASEEDCPYNCEPNTCGRAKQQYFCDGTSSINSGEAGDFCVGNNECKSGKCSLNHCCKLKTNGMLTSCRICQSKRKDNKYHKGYPGHCAHKI